MKKIKIFLASSVDEFKNERNELQCFIDDIAEEFREAYSIDIQVLRCEKVDPRYVKGRSQDEFNKLIAESEMCVFLFFTRAGAYTVEEFEVARRACEASENGKPRIYTYFKTVEGVCAEQSVTDFMQELDRNLNHFYQTFSHIDTVKLRVLLNLKMQEMDFVSVAFDGGKCLVDGKETLDLSNVSEFVNNGLLRELQAELATVEAEYYTMKPLYAAGGAGESLCRKYAEIASRRQTLLDAIEELQKSIFNMSLRMCRDAVRGDITYMQKEAYRLFALGDLQGANNVLDFSEIKSEYQRRKAMRAREQKADASRFVREVKTKIEILTAMVELPDRFAEIDTLYAEIVPEAAANTVELDTLYDYAVFLHEQNKSARAYEIGKQLETLYQEHPGTAAFSDTACLNNLLGNICCDFISKRAETEQYYLSAIEIYEKLAKENPDRFAPNLATSYNNTGVFYKNQGDAQKAERYYLSAIEIRKRLAKENPDRFAPNLATSYNNAGIFYDNQGDAQKAERYYLSAIEIRERLAKENPDRFAPDLAMSYNNAGNFYDDQGDAQKAERYYLSAIEIRERLAKENPDRFAPKLATSYNNTGVFYKNQGDAQKAERYYLSAIEIRKRLAKENPDRFAPNLATSYNNAGVFYDNQGDAQKAERYYLSAIEIYEKLAKENPDRFAPDLAMSYNNAGIFYDNQGDAQKAERYYLSAIEIRERLEKENPDRFAPDLASSYNNAGNFYDDQGDAQKAERYYLSAIEIRERLEKENPDRFAPDLATSYWNYFLFSKDITYRQKAYTLAKRNLQNPYCRQIVSICENA